MAGSCFVVIGDTSVARRVCSSLTQRGHDVRHAVRPDDAELSQTLDGARADGIAILLQDGQAHLRAIWPKPVPVYLESHPQVTYCLVTFGSVTAWRFRM